MVSAPFGDVAADAPPAPPSIEPIGRYAQGGDGFNLPMPKEMLDECPPTPPPEPNVFFTANDNHGEDGVEGLEVLEKLRRQQAEQQQEANQTPSGQNMSIVRKGSHQFVEIQGLASEPNDCHMYPMSRVHPHPPTPLFPDDIKPFLQRLGYSAHDDRIWQNQPSYALHEPPRQRDAWFHAKVTGHEEIDNHTFYFVECCLVLQGFYYLHWCAPRRLSHIREFLHDPIKKDLRKKYEQTFRNSPFAHHGGVPGTTQRLNMWMNVLSQAMNCGYVPPVSVGRTLRFCGVPAAQVPENLPFLLNANYQANEHAVNAHQSTWRQVSQKGSGGYPS